MAEASTSFDEIKDRLDHPPLTWAPKGPVAGIDADKQYAAATVVGSVEEVDIWESDWGRYPTLVLKTKDGTRVRVHGFSVVLQRQLGRLDPKLGDIIGVSYLGEVQSKVSGRKPYSNYQAVSLGAVRMSLASFAGVQDEDTSTGPPLEESAEAIQAAIDATPLQLADDGS